MENPFLSVIRVWAGLAWADGVIADEEAAAMKRLIESADLTDDDRKTAFGFMENKVDLETANIEGLSDSAREGIYRAAARLAAVDQHIADEEREFLDKLREGLKISDELAAEIEKSLDAAAK